MSRLIQFALPIAIIFAGALIALGLMLGGRHQTRQSSNVLWVTDRLTGSVVYCAYPTSSFDKWTTTCVEVPKVSAPISN